MFNRTLALPREAELEEIGERGHACHPSVAASKASRNRPGSGARRRTHQLTYVNWQGKKKKSRCPLVWVRPVWAGSSVCLTVHPFPCLRG